MLAFGILAASLFSSSVDTIYIYDHVGIDIRGSRMDIQKPLPFSSSAFPASCVITHSCLDVWVANVSSGRVWWPVVSVAVLDAAGSRSVRGHDVHEF